MQCKKLLVSPFLFLVEVSVCALQIGDSVLSEVLMFALLRVLKWECHSRFCLIFFCYKLQRQRTKGLKKWELKTKGCATTGSSTPPPPSSPCFPCQKTKTKKNICTVTQWSVYSNPDPLKRITVAVLNV